MKLDRERGCRAALRGAALALALSALGAGARCQTSIGVYYFPGWTHAGKAPDGWDPIRPFPERKPALGWYDDADADTVRTQSRWMSAAGIDYVVFDWYWGSHGTFLADAVERFRAMKDGPAGLAYCLLWANHDEAPRSLDDFHAMLATWISGYFTDRNYFRISGRPVVYVFDADNLQARARLFGSSAPRLLDDAQEAARRAGLPGIYFVSNSIPAAEAQRDGFAAISAYNYPGLDRPSHSFAELDADYRAIWKARVQGAGVHVPYIVPMTAGWDRTPWGGSKDREHDRSRATPGQFKEHLAAGKAFIQAHEEATGGMGVICCWNEFGEGSYFEPTQVGGFAMLDEVRDVFSPSDSKDRTDADPPSKTSGGAAPR